MARDTYASLWSRLALDCPSASPLLARAWINDAFRQVAERRFWSWLIRPGQFIIPDLYSTGTVTVTLNSTTVTGVGTVWTTAMEGRQFRLGTGSPIYTINRVNSGTSLELDNVWGEATAALQSYEIYLAYVTPPDDFFTFLSVWDTNNNWKLWTNIHQEELNAFDAQRSNGGGAYLLSARDYSTTYSGTIGQPLQVRGAGPAPASTSLGQGFTGPVDATFVVEVTLGGVSGVATFQWKKDNGAYTVGVVTSALAQDLADGVQVYWPAVVVYVAGDTFTIRCSANPQGGLPRYELWPHQKSAYVYPFLYVARATDLSDVGAVLPRYIRGDVLYEMALAEAAKWPGPSTDKPNPMFNLSLAQMRESNAERMIMEMEKQDDEVSEQDIKYQFASALPYAPLPWADSSWLQSHAI